MRLVVRLFILSCAVLFQGTNHLWADDLKEMQGVWNPVSAELGSQRLSADQLKSMRLKIQDGNYEVVVGDKADRGTLKIADDAKPPSLDIVGTEGPNKGKTILAIYDLKGDTLRICYALSKETKRPTEFKTGGIDSVFLVTYKRVK